MISDKMPLVSHSNAGMSGDFSQDGIARAVVYAKFG